MGMMFYDIDHKIMLLADLLHYTVKELEENLKHTQIIKESYYDLVIRTKEQESNPSDASSHEYPFIHDLMHRLGYLDRKSTRLNSSHVAISYAVFCLKK